MTDTPDPIEPPEDARCLGCAYALRGLTAQRCPECGREFDPADAWTMNVGRPHGRLVPALLVPVGAPTFAASVVAAGLVFWWIAGLPETPLAMALASLLWFAIYAYRLVRFATLRALARIYRQPVRREPRRRLMAPCCSAG